MYVLSPLKMVNLLREEGLDPILPHPWAAQSVMYMSDIQ